MNALDWSKAPQGATHYMTPPSSSPWRDLSGENWKWWDELVGWKDSEESSEAFFLRRHDRLIPSPSSWNGEGLPPVGTVCEFSGGTHCPKDPFDKDLKEGMKVTIIAHFKCGDFMLAAFTFDPENPDRGMVQVEQANFGCFRPIRTPEQIAADERESVINGMLCHDALGGSRRGLAEALYDAGYRKVQL